MFPRILLLFLLQLILSSLSAKGEPGKCRDGVSKDLTSQQLLRMDVFCSYDKNVRPVIQYSSNITVNMKMFIKFFTLDEINNIMEVHSWMALSWNDAHLKWTPSDYGNISALHVHTKEIWVPDLDIYNSGNMESYVGIKGTICVVYPKGQVLCVPVAKWPVHCKPNLRQWPFDSHECTMTIGSWTHAGEMIDIQLQNEGVSLRDFQESREWELTNATAVRNVASYDCCPNLTYPSVVYQFNIKRHASAYLATVIMPSLIMVVMTLSTFGLDPKGPHRLVLCSISILCHCLYLQYLGIKLPSNGNMTPVIVLFFRDSLVICGATLILSIIMMRLSSLPVSPASEKESTPFWFSRILGWVMNQRIGQILCLGRCSLMNPPMKGDGATLIENRTEGNDAKDKIGDEWLILVTVIDHLAFYIFSFTYIVLLIALIPVD